MLPTAWVLVLVKIYHPTHCHNLSPNEGVCHGLHPLPPSLPTTFHKKLKIENSEIKGSEKNLVVYCDEQKYVIGLLLKNYVYLITLFFCNGRQPIQCLCSA